MEEQNGGYERRNSEEDVGDLLLGVDEVLGNPAMPKKNGKGNEDEDEVHHVPAPSLTFHLERKPISCPGTPLDVSHTNGFPCQSKGMTTDHQCIFEEVGVWRESIAPARRLKLAAVKGNHAFGDAGEVLEKVSQIKTAGFQDGCIQQKGAAQRNRVGRKLAEIYYESNSKYRR